MSIKSSKNPSRVNPSNNSQNLITKLSNLEMKYNEFIANCSSYLQTTASPNPLKKPLEKVNSKRGHSTDILKENQKLKRQNDILSQTLQELNSKVSVQENIKDEYTATLELDRLLKSKNSLLDKQEKEMIQLKKELELERTRVVVQTTRQLSEKTSKAGSRQSSKKPKIPVTNRWMPKARDFSPIDRKTTVSPINSTVSPRDRLNHTLKQKVKSLQEDLNKVKEQRDLYKAWQKIVAENPPLPPSIEVVISKYETELETLSSASFLYRSSFETLAKLFKDYISETSKNAEKNPGAEEMKRKILDLIIEGQGLKNKLAVSSPKKTEENLNKLKISQNRLMREYEELEKICKREQSNADIALFGLTLKTAEINELKSSIEAGKISNSAGVTHENYFDSKGNNECFFSFGNEENLNGNKQEYDCLFQIMNEFELSFSALFKNLLMNLDKYQDKEEHALSKFKVFSSFVSGLKNSLKETKREKEELLLKYKNLIQNSSDIELQLYEKNKEIEELKTNYKKIEEKKSGKNERVFSKISKNQVDLNKYKRQTGKILPVLIVSFENSFLLSPQNNLKKLGNFEVINKAFNTSFSIDSPDEIVAFILDKNNKIDCLQTLLLEKEEVLSANSEEIIKITQEVAAKDQKISENKETIVNTLKMLEKTSGDLQKISAEYNSLKEEFATLQSYYDSLYSEKISLLETQDSSEKTIILLKNKLSDEQIQLEDQLHLLSSDLDSVKSENESLLDQLKQKDQDLNNLLQKYKKDTDLFKEIIQNYKQTTEKQEKELQSAKDAILKKEQKSTNLSVLNVSQDFCFPPRRKDSSLLSPHHLLRKESLEEMPEIVIDDDSSSRKTIQHETNESFQLSLLSQLQDTMAEIPSEVVVNWCKQILGNNNYVLRYPSTSSVCSEESKSNFDDVSVISENNQELNYRAHAKLMQQKKIIESLMGKIKDKKEKIKLYKLNIRTLQSEIRNLDSKLKTSGSIDIEYLKTSISSFSKNLKKIDPESFKILQVINSQLGLKIEPVSKKNRSFF